MHLHVAPLRSKHASDVRIEASLAKESRRWGPMGAMGRDSAEHRIERESRGEAGRTAASPSLCSAKQEGGRKEGGRKMYCEEGRDYYVASVIYLSVNYWTLKEGRNEWARLRNKHYPITYVSANFMALLLEANSLI